MRSLATARRALLVAIASVAVAALPGAAADLTDDLDFPERTYLRAAVGDIPRTAATESAGSLNVVLYQRFDHAGSDVTLYALTPFGASAATAECTCGNVTVGFDQRQFLVAQPGVGYEVRVPADAPAGAHVVAVRYSLAAAPAFTLAHILDGTEAPQVVVLYVPDGWTVASGITSDVDGLASTSENPGLLIYRYPGSAESPLTGPDAWFSLHPATAATPTPPLADATFGWLELTLGILLGVIVWAVLVSRGVVQRRSRRQVAHAAAHEELALKEPKPVLEARRRLLMAALKDLEVAKMNQEVDAAVYDTLKADFKRQTVAVMRALEDPNAAN